MKRIGQIARFTVREMASRQVWYVLVGLFFIFMGITVFFNYFKWEEQIRFVRDMGFTFFSFFAVILTLFGAVTLWRGNDETSKATYFLTKPVSRWEFLLGNFFGICLCLAFAFIIMGGLLFSILYFRYSTFSLTDAGVFYLLALKYFIFLSIVFFLSSFFDSLMVLFSAVTAYLFANSLTYFESISVNLENPAPAVIIQFLKLVLPNFYYFNSLELVGHHALSFGFFAKISGYSFGYAAVMLLLSGFLFSRREF